MNTPKIVFERGGDVGMEGSLRQGGQFLLLYDPQRIHCCRGGEVTAFLEFSPNGNKSQYILKDDQVPMLYATPEIPWDAEHLEVWFAYKCEESSEHAVIWDSNYGANFQFGIQNHQEELMPSRSPTINQSEALFIRKYFDGVDDAMAKELGSEQIAYEEFLTPTLGRLLDSRSPFQSILSYPVRELNRDLDEYGVGPQLIIEFKTNEHAKGFSGRVSHADLGIILNIEDPLGGATIKKGLLVEAKRLFPVRRSFSINSRYKSFDLAQFQALLKIASTLDWSGVYYIFFNPQLAAFDDTSQKQIRLIESHPDSGPVTQYGPEELYYLLRHRLVPPNLFQWSPPAVAISDPVEAREKEKEKARRSPGLRVLSVSGVKEILERTKGRSDRTLALVDCYSYARGNWLSSYGVPFPTLSEFVVDYLLSCFRGSTNEKIIEVAEGKSVDVTEKPDTPEGERTALLARHTLTISLQSHLPEGAHGIFAREQP